MLRTTTLIMFGLLACHAAGCTTLSVEEQTAACAETDWHRFGQNDGRIGLPTSARSDDFSTCADLGQPVNLAAYQAGRAAGLARYCTAESGYRAGYDGQAYENVCPPATEPDFLQGYDRGRADSPSLVLRPGFGIAIGSGGVRSGVGIGIGIGLFSAGSDGHHW